MKLIKPDEIETTDTKKHALKLLEGGKDGINWLAQLAENTVFLARPRASVQIQQGPRWLLTEFHIVNKVVDDLGNCKVIRLATNTETSPAYVWVDVQSFSNSNELVKILILGDKDIDYGNSDRTV